METGLPLQGPGDEDHQQRKGKAQSDHDSIAETLGQWRHETNVRHGGRGLGLPVWKKRGGCEAVRLVELVMRWSLRSFLQQLTWTGPVCRSYIHYPAPFGRALRRRRHGGVGLTFTIA